MSLSQRTRTALHRTSDPFGLLWLLTITGGGIASPVRLVNDTSNFTSMGETFLGLPFEVVPPKEAAKEAARAQLRIDNIGRELTAELEALVPGAELMATLQIVYRPTPAIIDFEFTAPLGNLHVDVFSVTAEMGTSDLMRRAATNIRFDPYTAPGLYPD